MNIPFSAQFSASSNPPDTPPDADGEPILFLRLNPVDQITTSWSWGPCRKFQSESEGRELLKTSLSKINKDPHNVTAMSVPVTDQDVKAFRKWGYFPHFDGPELRGKWYQKFNDLQGKQKTFWASGLNGFVTVEWAVRAGLR